MSRTPFLLRFRTRAQTTNRCRTTYKQRPNQKRKEGGVPLEGYTRMEAQSRIRRPFPSFFRKQKHMHIHRITNRNMNKKTITQLSL